MILQNKTVVVTGVGPGLGREVAAVALRDGANVVIAARTEKKLARLAAELDASGGRVAHCATDIGDAQQCERLVGLAVERFGGVDAVVQVAAYETISSTLHSTTADEWRQAFETNVVGTVQIVRAAAPVLKGRGGGSVVLIGTQAMWRPQMPQLAYAASKGGLLSAMYYLAHELGPDGIRVNMVVPTWMWGPPVQMYVKWQADERGVPEETIVGEIAGHMPLGRIPADEDVAEAVAFFCSDRSRMITGQSLLVNAGEMLR